MVVDYTLLSRIENRPKYVSESSRIKFTLDPISASALIFINSYCGFKNENDMNIINSSLSAIEQFSRRIEKNNEFRELKEEEFSAIRDISNEIEIGNVPNHQTINDLLDKINMETGKLITTAIFNYISDFHEHFNFKKRGLFPELEHAYRSAMRREDQAMMEILHKKRSTHKDHRLIFLPIDSYENWNAELYPIENKHDLSNIIQ